MQYVECGSCKNIIYLSGMKTGEMEDGDLHITYIICPYCGKKYVTFASDGPMRELVARRRALAEKLKMARAAKFREKTIRGYIREIDRIKAKQEEMMPALLERANAAAGENETGGKDDERETVET